MCSFQIIFILALVDSRCVPSMALPRGGGGREKREKEKGGGKKKKGGKGKKINSVSLYVS